MNDTTIALTKDSEGNLQMDKDELIRAILGPAKLEKSAAAWMDTEVMGIPVVSGVVGGAVAELASALIAKIPQLSGYGTMVTDLAAALALGWAAKKKNWEWAKYGAMFLVFAAFQPQIQSLVTQVAGAIPSLGGSAAATTKWAQDGLAQSNMDTPDEVERWLRSR